MPSGHVSGPFHVSELRTFIYITPPLFVESTVQSYKDPGGPYHICASPPRGAIPQFAASIAALNSQGFFEMLM